MSELDLPLPTVLVLASGRGERFRAAGGQGSKLAAPLAGGTVLGHVLASVRASGLAWHVEDAGHPGMGDSIAAAVRATPDAVGWLVLPGDLPLVQPGTLRAVAEALAKAVAVHGGDVAVRAVHRGEGGHPVAFGAGCGPALAALQGAQGAAPVLRSLRERGLAHVLEVEDAGILVDVDTPAALARAEALLRGRPAGEPR